MLHQESFTVRTYAIDLHKQITVPALVQLMQEAAMQQVIQLNISVWDLEPKQLSWVIMGLHLQVKRLPVLGEKIIIKTRPTGIDGIITYRGFWVFDTNDQLLAEASSHWVLMNTLSRKLSPIPDWLKERFVHLISDDPAGATSSRTKLPKLSQADYQKAFPVRWHDLDFNLHLINTAYILYLLEGLPADFLASHQLDNLHILYKSEARKDSTFQIQVQKLKPKQYIHWMAQGAPQKVLAEMRTHWK